jgi:hypothetical protein
MFQPLRALRMRTAGCTGDFQLVQKMPTLIKVSSGESRIRSEGNPKLTPETSKPKG